MVNLMKSKIKQIKDLESGIKKSLYKKMNEKVGNETNNQTTNYNQQL